MSEKIKRFRSPHAFVLMTLIVAISAEPVHARSTRVDSGDWDLSGLFSSNSDQALGFDFNFFGVNASSAFVSTNGGISLSGGGDSASLFPLLDPDQGGGGNLVQYQVGTTAASFAQPGVEAGFRVSWFVTDSSGSLLNNYQLSIFDLVGDLFAVEFNYDAITFGDNATQIGFSTSLGDNFDLASALGLDFADYMGVGDDQFSDNCSNTPDALACNNFFFETMLFGSDPSILPDIANGFFRQIDSNSNSDDVQGRYLFLTGEVQQIVEPPMLGLMALGVLALFGSRRKTKAALKS